MRKPTFDDLCMFFAGVGSVAMMVLFSEGKVLYGVWITIATLLNVLVALLKPTR